MRRVTAMAGMAVLSFGMGEGVAGQQAPAMVGVSLVAADPRGEMGAFVDDGFGGQGWATWPLDSRGHLRLRGDVGFVVYGHERQRLCFGAPIGCRIEVDLTTTNSIAYGGVGPELVLATGRVQPYVHGAWGFSYFATTSSLSGTHEADDWGTTTNFDDLVGAWRFGGGLRVQVAGGRTPVWLDVALERHENGVADYLTRGDIVDHADGSITLYPIRSEANLTSVRLGVSIGLPRGDDPGHRHDRRRKRGRRGP